LRDHLAQPHAGVEAFRHHVGERIVGDDLDGQARVTQRHRCKNRSETHGKRDPRRVDAEQDRDSVLPLPQALDGAIEFIDGPHGALQKGGAQLGQGDAPSRSGEERRAKPVLDRSYGVTDRRRAQTELGRRPNEAPCASDRQNDGQMGEQHAIHC
jgi:hypothetical protein